LLKPAVAMVVAASMAGPVVSATGPGAIGEEAARVIVIRGHDGDVLASMPLQGERFAVSYRNSIYGTMAEERYEILSDGRYRLVEIAADQLAVLEEYYAVPGAPRPAAEPDRREWVVPPDPERPTVLDALSIAATDLGERTVHVHGKPPLELWRLVEDELPFVVLDIEERP
jgi:hypothetical protein